jgi:hypothetical protein
LAHTVAAFWNQTNLTIRVVKISYHTGITISTVGAEYGIFLSLKEQQSSCLNAEYASI